MFEPPIGRHIHNVHRVLQRAFDDALVEAGGSMRVWFILVSIRFRKYDTQQELAKVIGVEGPTLTHHLDAMERDDLVTRTRDPDNRRAVHVALTPKGEKLFERLQNVARDFDESVRRGISSADLHQTRDVLARMAENVTRLPRE